MRRMIGPAIQPLYCVRCGKLREFQCGHPDGFAPFIPRVQQAAPLKRRGSSFLYFHPSEEYLLVGLSEQEQHGNCSAEEGLRCNLLLRE